MKTIGYELMEILFLIIAAVALIVGDLQRAIFCVLLSTYFAVQQKPRP